MSFIWSVVFGVVVLVVLVVEVWRWYVLKADRADLARKIDEAVAVNARLATVLAQNELLRQQVALQKDDLSNSHMREARYRLLSIDQLKELIALARVLTGNIVAEPVCDVVLLSCLTILEQHIALRRESHNDVHTALACFERGDPEQLRSMFLGLAARRPTEFGAITDRFPRRVEDFFKRLTVPDHVET